MSVEVLVRSAAHGAILADRLPRGHDDSPDVVND
jgi:hypothetical protein